MGTTRGLGQQAQAGLPDTSATCYERVSYPERDHRRGSVLALLY